MDKKSLLQATGEALFGERWQTGIANALGISDRHVRRMLADDTTLSPGMALDLWRICEERAQDIDDVIERLKVTARPGGRDAS